VRGDAGPVQIGENEGSEVRTETAPGTILGTVGYLSPEQVRGQEADVRSDLFALGAVLYEMLTGKRAFSGPTPADTLSAILREEPPPLATGSGPLPVSLDRVVRRCLSKKPEERFHSAHDVALSLEVVREAPTPVRGAAVVEVEEERSPFSEAAVPVKPFPTDSSSDVAGSFSSVKILRSHDL
jgi:serine/threonine protein kinase